MTDEEPNEMIGGEMSGPPEKVKQSLEELLAVMKDMSEGNISAEDGFAKLQAIDGVKMIEVEGTVKPGHDPFKHDAKTYEPVGRTFPRDTLMKDVPDDLTGEEALQVFGTVYDPSIKTLTDLANKIGMGEEQFHALHTLIRVTSRQAGLDLEAGEKTIEEFMPTGEVIDLMTLGLLAHAILSKVDIKGFAMGGLGGLLNGKGPFG